MFARPSYRSIRPARFALPGVAVLIALFVLAPVGRAAQDADAPLADRVPANAVIYVGWHGADGLGPAYEQSRLKGVIDATDCAQFLDPFMPQLIDRVEKEDKDAANAIRTVLRIGKPMWKHPSAFFFSGVTWKGKNDEPMPHLALLCQAGDDADALEKELREGVEEGMKQSPVPADVKVVKMDDGVVAIIVGEKGIAFPKDGLKSLATAAEFKSALSHVNKPRIEAGAHNRSVEDFARVDPEMANQVKQRGEDQLRWDTLSAQLGKNNPAVRNAKAVLDARMARTQAYADRLNLAAVDAGGDGASAPVAVGYVNFERLLKQIGNGIESAGDADAKKMWPKIRDASAIDGIKSAVWACGFDGKDWVDQAFVDAPAPRKGLLSLLDDQPISGEAVQLIPRTATVAGIARFDAARLLGVIKDLAGDIDPDARKQLEEGLQQASKTVGINIEDDLLKGLGDEWVYYTDPHTGGRGMMGIVLVNRLRDAGKVEHALGGLEQLANSMLAEQTKDEHMTVSFLTTKSGDLTIHYLGTPLVTPSWTIHDGNLYIAMFPQVVVSATDQVAGTSKCILENPDFAALRSRMNVESPTSFQFMDLPRTAPDAYAQWLMISRLSGFADLFGVKSPAMLLPPLTRLLPQLTAAGSVSWVDNDGWHVKAVTPFPGSTALCTDPLGGLMGMQPAMMGLALPMSMRKAEVERPDFPKPVEPQISPPPIIESPKPAPPPKP